MHINELEIISPIEQLIFVSSSINKIDYYDYNKDNIICPQDDRKISLNVIDIELF